MNRRDKVRPKIVGGLALLIGLFPLLAGGLPSGAFAEPNGPAPYASEDDAEPEAAAEATSDHDSEAILLGARRGGEDSLPIVPHPASLDPVIVADDELQLAACSPVGGNTCRSNRTPPQNDADDEQRLPLRHEVLHMRCDDGQWVPMITGCGSPSVWSESDGSPADEEQGVSKRPITPSHIQPCNGIPSDPSWCTNRAARDRVTTMDEEETGPDATSLPPGCDAMFFPGQSSNPATQGTICTPLGWVAVPDESEPGLARIFEGTRLDPGSNAMEIYAVAGAQDSAIQGFDHNELLCVATGEAGGGSGTVMQAVACPSELIAEVGGTQNRQTEQYAYTVAVESGEPIVWDTCWLSHPDEVTGPANECGAGGAAADSPSASITPAVSLANATTQRPEAVTGTVEVRVNGGTVVASVPVENGRAHIETAALDPGMANYEFVFLSANDQVPNSSFAVTAVVTEAAPTPGGGPGVLAFWGGLLGLAAIGAVVLLVGRPNRP